MATALLAFVVALPFVTSGACVLVAAKRPRLLLKISNYSALILTLAVSIAVIDAAIALPMLGGRTLTLTPAAQLGIQLMALAMLGLSMSLADLTDSQLGEWLPLAWLSLGGLTVGLLLTSLTLAALALVASGLVWALGPPASRPGSPTGPVLRYAALLALALPLLLISLQVADMHTPSSPELVQLAIALAVPGFGLLLSLIPLHMWTTTLAAGSPRPMVFGVLSLVQTAAFVLLLRTLGVHPWMVEEARGFLVVGGAITALVGGWFSLSSRLDDPDDWLAYAVIANAGFLVAGLGTRSESAGQGVTLLLFARVLAIVAIAVSMRERVPLARSAKLAGLLALAGIPGLAGFPGVWLILTALHQSGNTLAALALVAGSGLLLAAAYRRRWLRQPRRSPLRAAQWRRGLPLAALIAILVALGIAPQIVAAAFASALSGIYFPLP